MHPLESAYRKLSRGIHHRNEVNRLTKDFVKTKPYSMRIDFDPQTGDKLWIVERVLRTPPLGISIAIGDCIYNLRSALDHLAYQLVLINPPNQPTSQTAFPISDSPEYWDRSWKSKTKGMRNDAIALIKSCQPCFETHFYRGKWASWLENLCNVDKHRHLHITLAATSGGLFSQAVPYGARWHVHEGPIEDNTVMATLEQPNADVDFGFVGDVAFVNPGPASDEAVYPTLIALGVLVESILNEFGVKFFPQPLPSWRRTRRPGSV
jgi:hypothetical protein